MFSALIKPDFRREIHNTSIHVPILAASKATFCQRNANVSWCETTTQALRPEPSPVRLLCPGWIPCGVFAALEHGWSVGVAMGFHQISLRGSCKFRGVTGHNWVPSIDVHHGKMTTCVLSHGISRPSKINGTVAFPNSTNSDSWWFQENMWKDTWSQHVPTSTSRNFKTFLGFFSDFQCGSVHGAFGDLATGAKLVIFMEVSINGGTPSSCISDWDFPLEAVNFGDPQFMETHMYTVYAMHTLCILNYLDRWTGWKGIGEQKLGLRIEFLFIQIRKYPNWLKHMSQTNMTCAFHVIPSLHDKMSDWLSSPMGNVFWDTRILYIF